jgi:phosphoglucosamine mutase
MARKFFGTDGVRGRANTPPMTAEMALKLGAAAGHHFREAGGTGRVVIGKDTRRSGYMLENALTAGLTSVGMNVYLLGPVPTPAVGMLTRSMRADLGVMISASHNPHHDNGIKFFGPDGFKLSDSVELLLEGLLENAPELAAPEKIGRASRIEGDRARYVEFAKMTFPRRLRLDGMRVALDCANGAAYKTAPEVLYELGADVVAIGISPNGFNINKDVGSTSLGALIDTVRERRADIGIALDGDADRVMIVDETGNIADGDQIMGQIAARWSVRGQLAKNTLVATVMSNLGLERFLAGKDIKLMRTAVGDRYVVEAMRKHDLNLGGEQSGHIVFRDYVTTGDGLIAGLQFLAGMVESGAPASQLANAFETVPQLLNNIRFLGKDPLESKAVKEAIADGEAAFGDKGRVLIRKSGTEPLIRVMGECEDAGLLKKVVGQISAVIEKGS